MRYGRVYLEAIGYELAPVVVSSRALEERLAPAYTALRLQPGQIEALTGIRERRWWDHGFLPSEGAARAGRKALDQAGLHARDLGALVYAGVCREGYEPATACATGASLGTGAATQIFDVSNACLGVLNGCLLVANMIELGQIRSGLVVSSESAREIVDATVSRLLADPTMDAFRLSLATMTGGSGAVAVLLTDGSSGATTRRLLGGAHRAALEHHRLCSWGPDPAAPGGQTMHTDATEVLKHGVALGGSTWKAFLAEMGWVPEDVGKVICHQVGEGHRAAILRGLGLPADRDFSTFEYLGNMGTVALPITAALADERGFLESGDRVAFLGIGSGLNSLMLGWEW